MRRMFVNRCTSTDDDDEDDDIFFSKPLLPAQTPSRTQRIRRGKASVRLPAAKPNIKGEAIIEISSDDEHKSVSIFLQ